MNRPQAHAGDERGSIIILSTVAIVIAMIAAALAVDLGRLASDKRTDQKVADLAAIDAARDLTSDATACAAAQASAVRNGYNGLQCSSVVRGHVDPTTHVFSAGGANDAVQVTVRSTFSAAFPFVGGPSSTGGKAAAQINANAGFSIGSTLAGASLSAGDNAVINAILGKLVGGNLSVVSYDGLAGANVTLGALRELGLATVDELLTSPNVSFAQLMQASATVLSSNGVLAAADAQTIATALSVSAIGATKIKLGDMITVGQGSDSAALTTGINVLQLITGAAALANRTNFAASCLDVPNALAPVTVLNVGSAGTDVCLKVVEPPRIYIGPKGGHVDTSQVELNFAPTVNVGITLPAPLLSLLKASGTLPVKVAAAKATGTLDDVKCAAPQGIQVSVNAGAVVTSAGGSLDLKVLSTGVVVATVNTTGDVTTPTQLSSLSFNYPADFTPTAASKSTPSTAVGLNLASTSSGNVTITIPGVPAIFPLPAIPAITATVSAGVIAGAVFTAINPLLTAIRDQIASPAFAALGITIGTANVAALKDAFNSTTCGQPGLAS